MAEKNRKFPKNLVKDLVAPGGALAFAGLGARLSGWTEDLMDRLEHPSALDYLVKKVLEERGFSPAGEEFEKAVSKGSVPDFRHGSRIYRRGKDIGTYFSVLRNPKTGSKAHFLSVGDPLAAFHELGHYRHSVGSRLMRVLDRLNRDRQPLIGGAVLASALIGATSDADKSPVKTTILGAIPGLIAYTPTVVEEYLASREGEKLVSPHLSRLSKAEATRLAKSLRRFRLLNLANYGLYGLGFASALGAASGALHLARRYLRERDRQKLPVTFALGAASLAPGAVVASNKLMAVLLSPYADKLVDPMTRMMMGIRSGAIAGLLAGGGVAAGLGSLAKEFRRNHKGDD